MARYLVTGGAGFIGSHMVEGLLQRGHRVRVLDNFVSGRREHLAAVADRVEVIEGDVRDAKLCRDAVAGVEVVIHLAALHEVPRSVEDPMDTHEVNVTGTLNLLVAARDARVARFVLASSSAVYGASPVVPRSEDLPPDADSSPYAVSKLAGEQYCRLFASLYGLQTVALRYFNVYGSRQSADSAYAAVIPKFAAALLSGSAPTIYGDGEQTRDFLHVADCVAATLAACERPGLAGQVINIGTGWRTSVNELYAVMQRVLNVTHPPRYAPPLPGDVRHDQADIGKAARLLGYEPQVELARGLRDLLATLPWGKAREWSTTTKA
ncbi:SDR family oxidoreductase [Nitrospira sp. Kam-Ns4a]